MPAESLYDFLKYIQSNHSKILIKCVMKNYFWKRNKESLSLSLVFLFNEKNDLTMNNLP